MEGHFEPSYNIPPGVAIPMIRMRTEGTPVLTRAHWGFRPAWAGDKAPSPINARAESAPDPDSPLNRWYRRHDVDRQIDET